MLEVKNIKKSYKTKSFSQTALNGVSIKFRKNEFVAILGSSGSGKTTFLNIVGGLDRYDKGDLIINGKSTKKFKAKDWDSYRNNTIGFVFQSYNLIGHISVLSNVELGMTLSGIKSIYRKKRALNVLDKVGIKEHAYKKPNQLSGGQMQRVAIARALANDPDVILADEPTGALDSKTSVQIMNLIKEIAKDKLVIMVTHNREIAEAYADRIIGFKDGEVVADSNSYKEEEEKEQYNLKKTKMSFFTALKLSFNNILTKKGRTFLTAFASSIGIIGIALILSLSNGFDIQIKNFEKDTLSSMPITISEQSMQLDEDTMNKISETNKSDTSYTDKKEIYPQKSMRDTMSHTNILTKEYVDYVEKTKEDLVVGVSYTRLTSMNILSKTNNTYKPLNLSINDFTSIPRKLNSEEINEEALDDTYDLIYGKIPTKKEELLLLVDSNNKVSENILTALGFDIEKESINFDDILTKEYKLILNNDYYKNLGEYYTVNQDLESLYNSSNAITLKITGIIRGKEDKNVLVGSSSGLTYREDLINYIIKSNSNSDIVKKQNDVNYNVLTGSKFDDTEESKKQKEQLLASLGNDSLPAAINIYPKDFDSKEEIIKYLDEYNKGKEEKDKIVYTDYGKLMSSLSGNIMGAVTTVLILFSGISLVVSSIMIGIITYISVLERTKEIGVLRALGARKKDVRRVFNAETFIIGTLSGVIGILITRLLIIPTNIIFKSLTDLDNVAKMNPYHALILLIISVLLTLLGGLIPANVAAKKDPVIALRTE